ncbi:SMC-Scp complex subunit ScpB [Candidatus Poribacteria bacterium]|nr:MAG: SMC-Scp complex subunit ScpB [Candidatus Poribacteria bacterium]
MDLENVTTEHLMSNPDVAPEENIKSILEAILFAASEPISVKQFQHAMPGINTREIRKVLSELRDEYQQMNRSFHLVEIANGYQICTRPEFSEWIRKFYIQQVRVTLSPSALETLAIVAYKQPVTRNDVSAIRGVNSDSVINALVEKNLVCVSGRKEGTGRSLLFSTTDTFLQQFGLKNPSELPSLEEIEQLLSTSNSMEHLGAIQEDMES